MEENTHVLAEGVELVSMTEPKFKTTNISVMMLMPCEPEKFAAWGLLPNLLLNSCRKYPSMAKMTERMQELYGAYLDSSVSLIGDMWQMQIRINMIGDAYALAGEKLKEAAAELLLECILHPNLDGERAFSAEAFRMEQKELLDVIESEINDKRSYAVKRAKRTIFRGEPNANPLYGTKEEVLALTPETVYAVYEEILQKAQILIYYVGAEQAEELPEIFRKAFLPRKTVEICTNSPSKCKPEPEIVTETMEVNQCQLVMAFKADGMQSTEAMRMCSMMFGGAPFSLLFMNVREKMSLCYYCSSSIVYEKHTMLVTCGVSQENVEKARQAIEEQLRVLQNGEFEEKLLADAQRYFINALKLTGDTPSSCIVEAFERRIRPDHADVQEQIQLFSRLTKEEIIQTAKAFQLDSVYILNQKGES